MDYEIYDFETSLYLDHALLMAETNDPHLACFIVKALAKEMPGHIIGAIHKKTRKIIDRYVVEGLKRV